MNYFQKVALLLMTIVLLAVSPASAQSSKFTVQVSGLTLVPRTAVSQNWTTILGAVKADSPKAITLKLPAQKDLFFSVAIECGLYTRTLVNSKNGVASTAAATAGVSLRVVVDPGTLGERIAAPGEIMFCKREQDLSATLQGIIGNLACFVDGVFTPNGNSACVMTAETIELVLDTVNANAFFFALPDVGSGTHNIVVQSRIDFQTAATTGEVEAKALVGKGSILVEDVRLVRGQTIEF